MNTKQLLVLLVCSAMVAIVCIGILIFTPDTPPKSQPTVNSGSNVCPPQYYCRRDSNGSVHITPR